MVKEKKISIENGDLAQAVVGSGVGSMTPLILRQYVDPNFPNGIPGLGFIPWPWNSISVFGGLLLGAGSLIAGIVFKPVRMALIPMGVSSICVSTMLGLSIPPVPGGGLRRQVPAGARLKSSGPVNRSQGNVRLVSAGSPGLRPGGISNPSSRVNPGSFAQKSPEQRIQILQKEAHDAELEDEVKKLEAEKRQRESGPTCIPLRT